MLYAIMLAGGYGTRLWPVSRKSSPKQLTPVLGGDSLFMSTLKRLRKQLPLSRILVVTNAEQAALVRKQAPDFPEENLLVEPERRDTAAAIGFAAAVIHARDPKATILECSSDAHVTDERSYWKTLQAATRAAERTRRMVLVGIRPRYPETGYGYIKMGKAAGRGLFEVESFKEKPDLETAKAWVSQWEYLWNPAIIVARASVMVDAYRRHLPKMHKELTGIAKAWGTKRQAETVRKAFHRIVPIAIDYGITEKEKGLLVMPADFGWADVGHWRAVHEVLAGKPGDDVTRGPHLGIDCSGNLLYSFTGKLIATVGLKDMIVVETEDAVLVCPKHRAGEVKKIVEQLEKKKMKAYL